MNIWDKLIVSYNLLYLRSVILDFLRTNWHIHIMIFVTGRHTVDTCGMFPVLRSGTAVKHSIRRLASSTNTGVLPSLADKHAITGTYCRYLYPTNYRWLFLINGSSINSIYIYIFFLLINISTFWFSYYQHVASLSGLLNYHDRHNQCVFHSKCHTDEST